MKIKDYFTPKSAVYSGKHQNKETVVRHFLYNDESVIETDNFEQKQGYKSYIQVIGLTNIERIEELKNTFEINSLIFEDIFNVNQREKIDIKDNYLFCVIHGLFLEENGYRNEYMSMICTDNIVISFHEEDPFFLDTTIKALETYEDLREKTSDFLFYHILDLITDNHIDVFDKQNENIIRL
jgi:magnesium transporter